MGSISIGGGGGGVFNISVKGFVGLGRAGRKGNNFHSPILSRVATTLKRSSVP